MTAAVAVEGAPPNTVQTPEGHRWYLHPFKTFPDGGPEKFVSVTTAIDSMASPGLAEWYGYQAGGLAVEHLPALLKAARIDPCEGGPNRCRECIACAARWIGEQGKREAERRASEGKRTHTAMKIWIETGMGPDPMVDPDVTPYFTQVKAFFRDFGIEPADVLLTEQVVLNRTHWYAGTLDLVIRIRASASWRAAELVARLTGWPTGEVTIIWDLKTREKPDARFFPSMGLQVVGYMQAEVSMTDDGFEAPLPRFDGGAVVQVRPDGYDWQLVDTQGEHNFGGFLNHLNAFRWQCEQGGRIMGARTQPLPDELQGTCAAAQRVCRAAGRPVKLAKQWADWRKTVAQGDDQPVPVSATRGDNGTKKACPGTISRAKVQGQMSTSLTCENPVSTPSSGMSTPSTPSGVRKESATATKNRPLGDRVLGGPGDRLRDDDIPF